MSHFEFIFVLVSIILGLGLANLLNGIAKHLQGGWRNLDVMHLAFAFGMVLGIFVVWWGMYRWEDYSPFDFGTFMVIGLYASIYYSISVILFPRHGSVRTFGQIRRPFYAALVLYLFLELAYYQAGDLVKPVYYNFVWLAALGIFCAAGWLRKRWLDTVAVVYWYGLYSGWWFINKLAS
ncbi:MAG: hypothetical protein AAF438_11490 [Pseudomonadota bacterium]